MSTSERGIVVLGVLAIIAGILAIASTGFLAGWQASEFTQKATPTPPLAAAPTPTPTPAPSCLAGDIFTSKSDFLAKTGATSATGPIPNLGVVPNGTRLGSLRLSSGTAGDVGLWIGAKGAPELTDWSSLGENEIALGYENNFTVELDAPVFAFAFDFIEPFASAEYLELYAHGRYPKRVGTEGVADSTFQVILLMNDQAVGGFSFNAPNDVASFQGIWSDKQFNKVLFRETPPKMDDEYWLQFYTGTTPNPRLTQCILGGGPGGKPQCSDTLDNDLDSRIDAADPGCHTDRNPDNPASYQPTDDDERDSASDTTPTPTPTPVFDPGGVREID